MEVLDVEANGSNRQAVADEILFELNRFGHGLAKFFFEVIGPDFWVLVGEIHQQVAKEFDVVRLVTQGVAEHLTDARELVLAVKREDHTK